MKRKLKTTGTIDKEYKSHLRTLRNRRKFEASIPKPTDEEIAQYEDEREASRVSVILRVEPWLLEFYNRLAIKEDKSRNELMVQILTVSRAMMVIRDSGNIGDREERFRQKLEEVVRKAVITLVEDKAFQSVFGK